MALCQFSSSQLAVVFQRTSRILNRPSKKLLNFLVSTPPNPLYTEAVEKLHRIYMQKTMFYHNEDTITPEESIKYLYKYCDEIISELFTLHYKSQPGSGLAFNEMAVVLRTIQSFLLTSTISNSILKLHREYYEERKEPDIRNFNLQTFYNFIKAGRLEDAIKILKKHPRHGTNQCLHIESCLNPAPRVFGLLYHNENDFINYFEGINIESQKVVKLCEADDDFREISKIIAGSVDSFMRLNPTWIEYLIYQCLFVQGIVYDFESLSKTISNKFPDLLRLDKLLLEIIFGNLHSVIQKASEVYSSFFISHVVDLLSTVSKLPSDPQPEFENMNYPEYYFYVYVTNIISLTSLPVHIPCDYIFYNLGCLDNPLEVMSQAALIRLPNGNVNEMINYFDDHNLVTISKNIYKLKALESLARNDISQSLDWAIHSNDYQLKYQIENSVLELAVKGSNKMIEELVFSITPEVRGDSSVIIFLIGYINYLRAIENKDTKVAGEMLVKFFLQQTAPEDFYEKILRASVPLFESGLVLSYQNFLLILEAYEKVCNTYTRKKEPIQGFVLQLSSILAQSVSKCLSIKI